VEVKGGGQGWRSRVEVGAKMPVLNEYILRRSVVAVVVGFHCGHQLRASAARRAACGGRPRPAAAARGRIVTRSV